MILGNIKRLCKENNINIRELEAACGVGCGTIYKWAKSDPSIGKLKAVADYFGVTVDELLKNKEKE